jgi:hypothetical protein
MIKKYDNVKLINKCDSLFLFVGDTGQVVSDVFDDGYVAVAFDTEFDDSHDCEGLLDNDKGWFVNIIDLELI